MSVTVELNKNTTKELNKMYDVTQPIAVNLYVKKENDNTVSIYDKDVNEKICTADTNVGNEIFTDSEFTVVEMTATLSDDGNAGYNMTFEKTEVEGVKYAQFLAARNGYYVNPETVINPVSQEGANCHGYDRQDILKKKYDADERIVDIYIVYMDKTKSASMTIKVGDKNWQDIGFLPAPLYDEYKGNDVKHLIGFIIKNNETYKIIADAPIAPSSKEYASMKQKLTAGIIKEMPVYDSRAYWDFAKKNAPKMV